MGSRRTSRICALQALYALELNPIEPYQTLRLYWDFHTPANEDAERIEEIQSFTAILVEGVFDHQEEIDGHIQSSSKNWKLNRMAAVDRNILRLAVYELLYVKDIPKRVSINEAIELGKKFGSEDSGSFINGVLDKISQSVDKD
jgi:N utilization substance protein B